MPANFVSIDSIETLDAIFKRSFARPVVIFKHSRTCGISAHLMEEVSSLEDDINVVTVQSGRDISDEIAVRTGYRHQSPQAFVIRDGKAVYQASHYGIDPIEIEKFLRN